MTRNIIPEFSILENNPATIALQLFRDNDTDTGQEFALVADIGGVIFTVTDTSTGTPVPGFDNLAITPVSRVVRDNPVTSDVRWTYDHKGFNFKHTVSGDAFPEGDRCYRLEYSITPTSGEPYQRAVNVYTNEVYRV